MTSITEISYDRISGDGGTLDSYDECKQSYFKDNIICLSKKTNNDTLFLVPKSAYMNKKVEELLHGQLILVVKDACYDLHTGKFHILGDYYSLNIGVLSRWLTKSVLRLDLDLNYQNNVIFCSKLEHIWPDIVFVSGQKYRYILLEGQLHSYQSKVN